MYTLLPELSLSNPVVRAFVAPAFKLASHKAPNVSLHLHWPPPTLDALEGHRLFHVAYEISRNRRWLFLAAIDDKAEYHCLRVRYIDGLDMKTVLRRVWSFIREASESASIEWRICIARLGSMAALELQGEPLSHQYASMQC